MSLGGAGAALRTPVRGVVGRDDGSTGVELDTSLNRGAGPEGAVDGLAEVSLCGVVGRWSGGAGTAVYEFFRGGGGR